VDYKHIAPMALGYSFHNIFGGNKEIIFQTNIPNRTSKLVNHNLCFILFLGGYYN